MSTAMRVHHLNLGAMQPYGGALFDGQTPGLAPAELTCHCLLLETDAGLVLIDTGISSQDPAEAARRHSPIFRTIDRVRLDPAESAVAQIRTRGHNPTQVVNVIMTHLFFDHAAGLADLPTARVHLSSFESAAARMRHTLKAQHRYRPAQWGDQKRWKTYGQFNHDWYGLPASVLEGLSPDILLVALPGHTEGHCGVAVRTEAGWLLHAADAIFNHRELADLPSTPTAARAYQWFMQTSQRQRRRSLAQLRVLHANYPEIRIICTHDPSLLSAA